MPLSYNILIVDDVVENIQVAMNILKEENYNFSFALNGEEALKLVHENKYDLILLDIMMPGLNGYEVCKKIKAEDTLKDIPIVFLTAKADIDSLSEAFSLGAVDYITKPFHAEELLVRVKNHLELYRAKILLKAHNISLQIKVEKEKERLLSELENSQKEIIYVLTELMESTSDETGQHIKRVANVARLLAHYHPALDEEDADILFHAAPMHDIGKVGIDHKILHKPSRLDVDEFEIMKTHTTIAHNFLKNSKRKIIKSADIIALQHHEKYDGSGYPAGLIGENIHIYGRIVALADVFDALTHKRTYKDAWTVNDAVAFIEKNRGTHFDPLLVDLFMENIDEFISIAKI